MAEKGSEVDEVSLSCDDLSYDECNLSGTDSNDNIYSNLHLGRT